MNDDFLNQLGGFGDSDDSDESEDKRLFAKSIDDWVETFLKPHYVARRDSRWCDHWRRHTQAVFLFEGLWRSYEEARASDMVNAGGQSTMNYYIGHFIAAVDYLTRPDGTFAHCEPGHCDGQRTFGNTNRSLPHIARRDELTFDDRIAALSQRVRGQDAVIEKVATHLTMLAAGVRLQPNRPAGVFLFSGPSGCGKTELAHAMAESEYGRRDAIIRLDLGEYSHWSDASRLTGPAPGYMGNDQPEGWLTTKLRNKPACVLLLDEVEKAHKTIFDTLLAALDAGRLTDGRDQTADLKDVIVVMTSNLGSEEYGRADAGFSSATAASTQVAKRVAAAVTDHFRPEFLGRLDAMLQFQPLGLEVLVDITERELEQTTQQLEDKGWRVQYDPALPRRIAASAERSEYGARRLHRLIEEMVVAPVVCAPKGEVRISRTGKVA